MSLRPIRIGLLWHSASSGNLGVGALTIANMAIVRQVAAEMGLAPEFRIIGMADRGRTYVDRNQADVFAVTTRSLLSPGGCWSVMGAEDCILDIGAGDSFAEIYGAKRFSFIWLTKMLARARAAPLLLSPQTIGPFRRAAYTQLARMALAGAYSVVVRDPESLDALARLAPKTRGVLAVDVAFALGYEDRSAERGGERLRVGINVSGLLFNEAVSGRNRFGMGVNYVDLMRRLIGELAGRPDVEVCLVTHVVSNPGDWEDDAAVTDRLAAEFPGVTRAPDFPGPSEAKSYISSLDFLIAGRMHACIAAFSAGVPVVPVAYSRKFSGLFGMLDYGWMVPVTGVDGDQAMAYLDDCIARRAELKADVERGMSKVDALLGAYRDELKAFFTAVMARSTADAAAPPGARMGEAS